MENKQMLVFILFVIVIFYLSTKRENFSQNITTNRDIKDDMYSSEGDVLNNNVFLPKSIVSEGDKIPQRNYESTWYYGFPSRKRILRDGRVEENRNSGFTRINIPANSDIMCSNTTFKRDPNASVTKFCFEVEKDKIIGFKNQYSIVNPNGNIVMQSQQYGDL
jgi:hypothetical protein